MDNNNSIQPDLEQVEQQLDQQETLQEGQQVDQQEIQQLNQQETLQEAQQVDQREKQQELNTMAKSAAPVPRSSQDDLLFELETEIAAAIGYARNEWWLRNPQSSRHIVMNLELLWTFTTDYSQFANNNGYDATTMLPKGYQKWNEEQIQQCIIAIQKKHLTVDTWPVVPHLFLNNNNASVHVPEENSSSSSIFYQDKAPLTPKPKSSKSAILTSHKIPLSLQAKSFINSAFDTETVPSTSQSKSKVARKDLSSTPPAQLITYNPKTFVRYPYQGAMTLLMEHVKEVTGHAFTGKPTTVLQDKLNGPGSFKWKFSEAFPDWPSGNNVSRWSTRACQHVEEALRTNKLCAVSLGNKHDGTSAQAVKNQSRNTTIEQKLAKMTEDKEEYESTGLENVIKYLTDYHKAELRRHTQELLKAKQEGQREGYQEGLRAGLEQAKKYVTIDLAVRHQTVGNSILSTKRDRGGDEEYFDASPPRAPKIQRVEKTTVEKDSSGIKDGTSNQGNEAIQRVPLPQMPAATNRPSLFVSDDEDEEGQEDGTDGELVYEKEIVFRW